MITDLFTWDLKEHGEKNTLCIDSFSIRNLKRRILGIIILKLFISGHHSMPMSFPHSVGQQIYAAEKSGHFFRQMKRTNCEIRLEIFRLT